MFDFKCFNVKKQFNFDVKSLVWEQYIEDYCVGSKVHLLNEEMTTFKIDECRHKFKRYNRYFAFKLFHESY